MKVFICHAEGLVRYPLGRESAMVKPEKSGFGKLRSGYRVWTRPPIPYLSAPQLVGLLTIYHYTCIPLSFEGISGVESLFLLDFKYSAGDGHQNALAPDSCRRPQPWGQAPGIEMMMMPGGGRAPARNGDGITEKCDQASNPAPGWCHPRCWGTGTRFQSNPFSQAEPALRQ